MCTKDTLHSLLVRTLYLFTQCYFYSHTSTKKGLFRLRTGNNCIKQTNCSAVSPDSSCQPPINARRQRTLRFPALKKAARNRLFSTIPKRKGEKKEFYSPYLLGGCTDAPCAISFLSLPRLNAALSLSPHPLSVVLYTVREFVFISAKKKAGGECRQV